ncbi:methyltransferase domain-containing protein [Niveibacterium sp.]|uniref:methyltransferase domain-containing protein n=1 Tax=Niveibacterium sp. TaxID=2017444 RepID=UPI0035B49EDF
MRVDSCSVTDGVVVAAGEWRDDWRQHADAFAVDVVLNCGGRDVLIVGCRDDRFVRGFLRLGINAHGFDTEWSESDRWADAMPGRFHHGSLYSLPFRDDAFDMVVVAEPLELYEEHELEQVLAEIKRVTRRSVYLRVPTLSLTNDESGPLARSRAWWERTLFGMGFRKHPAYYRVNPYASLEVEGEHISIIVERIPDLALRRYPLDLLQAERDLHMDMFREAGARSDAHIARYQWACEHVRQGDVVLDAACGLGYGSYLLQTGSEASQTIGIDGSAYAIDYAECNFGSCVQGLKFHSGMLPDILGAFADNSVDVVVSFETLEHVDRNEALLSEFHRILTPAGRILVSVPNDWSDETGTDPNPFHLHVYTLERLRAELQNKFVLEKLVAQSASQHKIGPDRKVWAKAPRRLEEVSVDVTESVAPDCEWWLAVAMRSPSGGEAVRFRDSAHSHFDYPDWNVTRFERDYRNPWLVRCLVDVGHRVSEQRALTEMADAIIETNAIGTPDFGAALCVRAYQLLKSGCATFREVESLEVSVAGYATGEAASPHIARWRVSLYFVLGKLWMEVGDFARARLALSACAESNALAFSPLLCNRTVEARLLLGVLALVNGESNGAREHWAAGMAEARRALESDWRASLGDLDRPAEFGFPELASILEYASACAYSLIHVDEFPSKHWWWLHPRRDRLSQALFRARELSETRFALTGAVRELEAYRSQANAFVERIAGIETERASVDALVAQKCLEIEGVVEQAGQLQNELKKAQDALTDADKALLRQQAELNAYRSQTEVIVSQQGELKRELAAAYEEIERQAKTLSSYESQSGEYERIREKHAVDLRAAYAQIERQRNELLAYELQAGAFAQRANELETNIRLAYAQIQRQVAELDAYGAQTAQLIASSNGVRQQLDDAYLQLQSQSRELLAYEAQTNKLLDASRERELELTAAYAHIDTQTSELQCYAQQASQLVAAEAATRLALQDAYSQLKQQAEELDAFRAQTRIFVETLAQKEAELAVAYSELSAQRKELEAYRDQAEVLVASAREERCNLNAAYAQLEMQRNELGAYKRQAEKFMVQLRESEALHLADVSRLSLLSDQLVELRKENEVLSRDLLATHEESAMCKLALDNQRQANLTLVEQRLRELGSVKFLSGRILHLLSQSVKEIFGRGGR